MQRKQFFFILELLYMLPLKTYSLHDHACKGNIIETSSSEEALFYTGIIVTSEGTLIISYIHSYVQRTLLNI